MCSHGVLEADQGGEDAKAGRGVDEEGVGPQQVGCVEEVDLEVQAVPMRPVNDPLFSQEEKQRLANRVNLLHTSGSLPPRQLLLRRNGTNCRQSNCSNAMTRLTAEWALVPGGGGSCFLDAAATCARISFGA